MNKRFHRVVFNAARGIRMVVQERARSAGKASGAKHLAQPCQLALKLELSMVPKRHEPIASDRS